MSNYSNHLEQSKDVVKSGNKLERAALITIYLGVCALSLIVFWFFTSGSDAMGFSLLFLWLLLPLTTFVISLLIGRNNHWGKLKWVFPIFFGIMYMLVDYGTFSVANMIAFDKINMPHFETILPLAIISFIGLAIGTCINYLKRKSESTS